MFCPECQAEFRPDVERCFDCDIPLVPKLEPVDHSSEEQIVVHESSSPDEIPVVKSLLRAAGIPFLTEGESLDQLFPSEFHTTLIEGDHPAVRFLVPLSRAEEARALLDENPEFEKPINEELSGDDD